LSPGSDEDPTWCASRLILLYSLALEVGWLAAKDNAVVMAFSIARAPSSNDKYSLFTRVRTDGQEMVSPQTGSFIATNWPRPILRICKESFACSKTDE
jgi:hypothetical protein